MSLILRKFLCSLFHFTKTHQLCLPAVAPDTALVMALLATALFLFISSSKSPSVLLDVCLQNKDCCHIGGQNYSAIPKNITVMVFSTLEYVLCMFCYHYVFFLCILVFSSYKGYFHNNIIKCH